MNYDIIDCIREKHSYFVKKLLKSDIIEEMKWKNKLNKSRIKEI